MGVDIDKQSDGHHGGSEEVSGAIMPKCNELKVELYITKTFDFT
jgi:hypothetical protein